MTRKSKKTPRKSRNPAKRKGKPSLIGKLLVPIAVGLAIVLVCYVVYLDGIIREKFDGKRWDLPAVVYARPLELFAGLPLTADQFENELQLAGYRREDRLSSPGGYVRRGDDFLLFTRDFHFPDGPEKARQIEVRFSGSEAAGLNMVPSGEPLAIARLDPVRIGSFHPRQHEDRIVLEPDELPDLLVKTLLAVEDRNFYSHFGLDPRAIARALLSNIRAGGTVQGGSTLTQQLVKNFFLNNERTIWRKANEAIMALLLELHYSKEEILTAYANEIFLGQDGGRAVHGFALASLFYFRRDLEDLSPARIATLVGMVKGPSYYDPRRHPERCRKRRQVVLEMMRSEGVIDAGTYETAAAAPLGKADRTLSGFNRFPAFLDVVRRQLNRDYREEDLTGEGLKIFTTLDPQVQMEVERELAATIARLERERGVEKLEGAVVVSNREGGEILAVAGARKPLYSGFNRALDARRPIGSLIKPAVYLTALENGYTLASPLADTQVTLDGGNGSSWRPANFDRKQHGRVPLYRALAHSYNLATVNLGMEIGLAKVMETVAGLGVNEKFPAYPSFLLGAAPMSPIEVSQMYQTLATGGFFLPQRVISTVLASDDRILQRFGLSVTQRFSPESVFLVNTALQKVVSEGTGRTLSRYLDDSLDLAGKTGTSDDLRDSWFAGFGGRHLAVVWLGRDDNASTGLTGGTGALVVWGRIMAALHPEPLMMPEPADIEWAWLDPASMAASSRFSSEAVRLPFIRGSGPGPARSTSRTGPAPSGSSGLNIIETIKGWFK